MGGTTLYHLVWGGLTNFTQAIFEVGGDTAHFSSILQFFPHLINYVAVCKQYNTILSIIVYLYKSFSIDVKCKERCETRTHFLMWGGVVRRTQNWGVESIASKPGGGVVCRTRKWGDHLRPKAARFRAPPSGCFWQLP